MLSPVDIQNKEFRKNKLGGYHIGEVDEFLELVLKSYQELTNENYALKDKMNVLNESVQYYRTMESTIQNVLVLADKTAQDTKSSAYEKAEQIKAEAEKRSEKMIDLAEERVGRIVEEGRQEAFEITKRIEELKRQYIAYKAQFKQLLQGQMDLLEQNDHFRAQGQDDLVQAFSDIEEEATMSLEEFKPLEPSEREKFYTKEYMPVSDEELA